MVALIEKAEVTSRFVGVYYQTGIPPGILNYGLFGLITCLSVLFLTPSNVFYRRSSMTLSSNYAVLFFTLSITLWVVAQDV